MGARAVRSWVAMSMLMLSAFVLPACGRRGTPIQSPVTVNAGQTHEQTEWAVRDVLARRHWTVELQQPGRMVAYLIVRRHRLRVDIRYDPQYVNVYYVDSENLNAQAGPDGVYAHPKVNLWLNGLATDIAGALATIGQPGTSGGSVAPPQEGQQPAQPGPAQYPPAGQPLPSPGPAPASAPLSGVH
jgi:hypothetical protein